MHEPATEDPAHRGRVRAAWAASALAVVAGVALVFAPILGHGFINLDDPDYVTDNPHVRAGLTPASLAWAFNVGHAGNWHPLTWISHMTDVALFGLHPAGHHATSLLLHAGNALLVFLLLRRLVVAAIPADRRLEPGAAAAVAALATLVFAIHPLRIESVAWVAERKDVLSALFGLATVLAYLRRADRPGWRADGAVALLFAAGLAAKPMLVSLPLVLLVLDAWPLGRWGRVPFRRLILEKTPLFVLAAASCVVTMAAQRAAGAITGAEALPIAARVANAVVSAAAYTVELVVPGPRSPFWPYPPAGHPWPLVAAAALLLAIATGAAVALRRRAPWFLAGWLWFAITLVPVLGFVQVGMQARADRYTYLPHVGLTIVLAGTAARLLAWPRGKRRLLAAAGLTSVTLLGAATRRDLPFWRDSVTLFTRAASVAPGNYFAYFLLGLEYDQRGRVEEAVAATRQVIGIRPSFAPAYDHLGQLLARQGRVDEGLALIREGIRRDPRSAWAHYTLGSVLLSAGRARDAIEPLRRAVDLDPRIAAAHMSLGIACAARGEDAEAVDAFRAAAALDPRDPQPWLRVAAIGVRRRDPSLLREAAAALEPIDAAMAEAARADLRALGEDAHRGE